jgi:hypothetical protein
LRQDERFVFLTIRCSTLIVRLNSMPLPLRGEK